MAEGLNRVTLLGSLGADPDLKHTDSGSSILTMRLATTTRYKSGDDWKDRTVWHSIKVWGKRGEALKKHLVKGSRVYVEGELRSDEYEKDGEKKFFTYVNAVVVLFAGGKSGEAKQANGKPNGSKPPAKKETQPDESFEDDIPF